MRNILEPDREVLTRFYLNKQSPEDICQNKDLIETQIPLIKSWAKAWFGELGKRRLESHARLMVI